MKTRVIFMIKNTRQPLMLLMQCIDILIFLLSMLTAYGLRFFVLHGVPSELGLAFYLQMAFFSLPVYLLLYYGFELYDISRYKSILSETEKIVNINLIGMVFLFLSSFFLRVVDISRMVIILFTVINATLSALSRASARTFLRTLRRRGYGLTSLLIVGWNESSSEFYNKLSANIDYGYQVAGCLSQREFPAEAASSFPKRLGTIGQLEEVLQACPVDEVVISLDSNQFNLLGSIIEICDKEGVKSSLLPFYIKYLPAQPYMEELDGIPLINFHRIPLDDLFNRFMKRSFDIAASLILMVLLSPLMASAALAIRLSSPGPVIYRQERVGRNKKNFVMYKFRSMDANAPGENTTWGTKNDSRRTRVGAFLRKFSIDELPQLFNVLKGDMSLVGPRPERPFFVEKFRDEVPLYMLKHLVRPGITGWAQVNGWRGDTSIMERVKCDLFYIENWSFFLDIKILILTLFLGIVNQTEEF